MGDWTFRVQREENGRWMVSSKWHDTPDEAAKTMAEFLAASAINGELPIAQLVLKNTLEAFNGD